MKSPLVDVLRQAQQDVKVDDGSAVASTPSDYAADVTRESTTAELDLLETGTLTLDGDEENEAGLVAGETAHAESTPDVDTGDATPGEFSTTGMLDARGFCIAKRRVAIAVIGRLSPFICLFALAASAGGYFLANTLAVAHLNGDLDEMSEKAPLAARDIDLPMAGVSVFEQLAATEVDTPVVPATRTPQATQTKTTGQELRPANSAPNVVSTLDISINKSVGGTKIRVGDPAFVAVSAAYAAYSDRRFDAALEHYLQALSIEPNHRDALAGAGASYRQLGREQASLRLYEKLLAVDPGNVAAASAVLLIRSAQDGRDTESELKHLLGRFPESHHLHFSLGKFYGGEQRWPEAKNEFIAAHRIAPGIAAYSYNAAVSIEKTGAQETARKFYEIALATADDDANVDRAVIVAHLSELDSRATEQL